jgi:hypothetical protein
MKMIDNVGNIKYTHALYFGSNIVMSETPDGVPAINALTSGTGGAFSLGGSTNNQTMRYDSTAVAWVPTSTILSFTSGQVTIGTGPLIVGTDPGTSDMLRIGGTIIGSGSMVLGSYGAQIGATVAGLTIANAGRTDIRFYDSTAATDAKTWDFSMDGNGGPNTFNFLTRNDAFTTVDRVFTATRSGATLTGIAFVPDAGVFIIGVDPGGSNILRVGGSVTIGGTTTRNYNLQVASSGEMGIAIKNTEASGQEFDLFIGGTGTYGAGTTYRGWFGINDGAGSTRFAIDGSQNVNLSGPDALSNPGLIVTTTGNLTFHQGFGTIDGSGERFGNISGPPVNYDVLSYDGTNSLWRPRLLQTSFTTGVVSAQVNPNDGTFYSLADTNPILANGDTPSTPAAAPILTPIYDGMIIDMSAVPLPGAHSVYCIDYSNYTTGSGTFTTNAILSTGAKVVHSNLNQADQYVYHYRIIGVSSGTYSPLTAPTVPSNVSETNAYGLIVASQISTVYLSAITANVGQITAGQINGTGRTCGLQLSGDFAIPGTWQSAILMYGGNPAPTTLKNYVASGTGMYMDFTATGTNPILSHNSLTLNADGSATFGGQINIITATLSQGGKTWSEVLHYSGLNNGMSSLGSTDIYGMLGIIGASSSGGGLAITALSATKNALTIIANGTSPTTDASTALVTLSIAKANGSGGITTLASTEDALQILTSSTLLLGMKGNGDISTTGFIYAGTSLYYNPGTSSTKAKAIGCVYTCTPTKTINVAAYTTLDSFTYKSNWLSAAGHTIRLEFSTNNGSNGGGNAFQLKWGSVVVWTLSPTSNQNTTTTWICTITYQSSNIVYVTVTWVNSDGTSGENVSGGTAITLNADETVAIQGFATLSSIVILYQANAILIAA